MSISGGKFQWGGSPEGILIGGGVHVLWVCSGGRIDPHYTSTHTHTNTHIKKTHTDTYTHTQMATIEGLLLRHEDRMPSP